jgi:hypothetical protein
MTGCAGRTAEIFAKTLRRSSPDALECLRYEFTFFFDALHGLFIEFMPIGQFGHRRSLPSGHARDILFSYRHVLI